MNGLEALFILIFMFASCFNMFHDSISIKRIEKRLDIIEGKKND